MNARLHLRCQRFHFYKQSINNSQERNRHYAADTLHKRKIPHKPRCDYAVTTHHAKRTSQGSTLAKNAIATQAHASGFDPYDGSIYKETIISAESRKERQ